MSSKRMGVFRKESDIMQLVEQHVIKRNDPRFAVIDAAAFKSKNHYNAALYEARQSYIHKEKYLNYNEMDKHMQPHEAYKALPAKVSQQVLKQLHEVWTSYFEACAAYRENPEKFLGHPKIPKYKHKVESRHLLVYTIQAVSQPAFKDGLIRPSQLPITIKK